MEKKEFTKRRRQLMDMMGDSSIAIITTAPVRLRNRDVEFSFRPDSDSLAVRSKALVSWCEGFLYGLGVSASQASLDEDKDGQEFLSDLAAITRLTVNVAEEEDNEVAYAEIVEYVRTGVMMLHEMALSSPKKSSSGRPE